MSNDIASSLTELETIVNELNIRKIEMDKLKKRKKTLEDNIAKFLKEKDQPGIKYKGIAAVLEDKTKRIPKKKSQKIEDCVSVLKGYGVQQPERMLKDIIETMKGDEEKTEIVKIKNIKGNSYSYSK